MVHLFLFFYSHLAVRKMKFVYFVLAAALVLSACSLPLAVQTNTPTPVPSPTEQSPTAVATVPSPVATDIPSATPSAPETFAYQGFAVFNPAEHEFQTYDFSGSLLKRLPAPGLEHPSNQTTRVVGQDIFYYSFNDKKIFRTNEQGVTALEGISAGNLQTFILSPDLSQIVWSTLLTLPGGTGSEMWIANLDGSDAQKIASYSTELSRAFLLEPLTWTEDGQILFDRSLSGFGGYILYGGHNSLYGYTPSNGQFTTYVPAEEMNGLCLDSYRIDLERVVFNCGKNGSQITIRDLKDTSEMVIPELPGYPITGSAHFSPSGQWLAYAAAEGNPDHERGKVLVVPANQVASPSTAASIDNGYYSIHGWLNETTLLVSLNSTSANTVMKVTSQGQVEALVQGQFVGMLP